MTAIAGTGELEATEPLIVSDDGPVRWWRLNRPAALNALNAGVLDALATEIDRLEEDPGVRCVVVTGVGEKAFSAGADLDELDGLSATEAAAVLASGQHLFRRIEWSRVPVLAAVNGYALGGGFELCLSCAFILASDNARFGLPETNLGLIPGYGGTQRLPRLVGRQKALYVMLTGWPFPASRAFELGLLAEPPVARADLEARARELARIVSAKGPGAVRAVLEAVGGADEDGLRRETAMAAIATSSTEAAVGIAAFRDKRTPRFADSPG